VLQASAANVASARSAPRAVSAASTTSGSVEAVTISQPVPSCRPTCRQLGRWSACRRSATSRAYRSAAQYTSRVTPTPATSEPALSACEEAMTAAPTMIP